MIMPIALARDGFIDRKESVTFLDTDTFLSALNKVFTFVDKDLQNFDGNSCKIAIEDDPTNSIFIYSNDLGTFLYQIQTATPYMHKNKMLWDCTCYKMENIDFLDNLMDQTDEYGIINHTFIKKIKDIYLNNSTTEDNDYVAPSIKVKENFISMSKIKEKIIIKDANNNQFAFLKIKFLIDPSVNQIYKSTNEASDGSFSFLFVVSKSGSSITTKMRLGVTENYVNLIELISTYSENIKSIEIIPFDPTLSKHGTLFNYQKNANADYVTITNVQSPAAFNNALGIFYPTGSSVIFTNYLLNENNNNFFEKTFTHGGGARGFLKTPLGNILLDFNSNIQKFPTNDIYYKIKEEGISIDGLFKCEIPPHYLNFYTDNAGQVFIQNMTINAQELRQINRDYLNTAQNAQSQAVSNAMSQMLTNFTSILNGSILGSLASFGANKIQYEQTVAQNKNNYDLAKANYEDKLKTQNILANYTGKSINGNLSILDFFMEDFCFELNVEFNYIFKMEDGKKVYLSQKDYDYSCENIYNYNYPRSLSNEKTSFLIEIFKSEGIYNVNASVVFQIERSKDITDPLYDFAFNPIYSKIISLNIRFPQKRL